MKPAEHINLVAVLHIAWSILLLLVSGLILVLFTATGLLAEMEEGAYIAMVVGSFASVLLSVTGVAGLVGAYGLYRRRTWGRFTILVLSAVWLIKIPVGTALGIYSFYALTRDEVVALFHDSPAPGS